ncbi:MAG: hypothetical protein IJR77_02970 [Bacteroidales bacterium]|nr:hypothetical protein [Bacteroidales bacterium]
MNATVNTIIAVYRLSKHFIFADGEMTEAETNPLFCFLQTFPAIDNDMFQKIMADSDTMTDGEAISEIRRLDDDGKQQISNLFARIICADGELTEDERNLFFKVRDLCDLPDPEDDSEEKPAEEASSEEDRIIPAFILANFYGIASVHQSEHEDWNTLGDEIASWMGCDRVEVVRYTRPLNALTEELRLNGRHLVFMVARNGYGDKTVGDNMTATLLYGGGYPLYGNIVFALETDQGYEIEGFQTRSLLNETFEKINNAVDGLLRTE